MELLKLLRTRNPDSWDGFYGRIFHIVFTRLCQSVYLLVVETSIDTDGQLLAKVRLIFAIEAENVKTFESFCKSFFFLSMLNTMLQNISYWQMACWIPNIMAE